MSVRQAMHWKCRAWSKCRSESFLGPNYFYLSKLYCTCGKEMRRIRVVRIE